MRSPPASSCASLRGRRVRCHSDAILTGPFQEDAASFDRAYDRPSMSMLVLCNGCGMRVLTLADGSCPSCGAKGEIVERLWRGKRVDVLLPEPKSVPLRHACLCLRPYAVKFRSAARLRAVGRAMRPFGTTVALMDQTDRPFRRLKVRLIGWRLTMVLNVLLAVGDVVWTVRRRGVQLVGKVEDATWQATFRGLALHAQLIVMDVSASGSGLVYETDYIADLGLADRLILIQTAESPSEDTRRHLAEKGVNVPLLVYRTWRLGEFARELRHTARRMMDAKAMT